MEWPWRPSIPPFLSKTKTHVRLTAYIARYAQPEFTMKLATFSVSGEPRFGSVTDRGVLDLTRASELMNEEAPGSLSAALTDWDDSLRRVVSLERRLLARRDAD